MEQKSGWNGKKGRSQAGKARVCLRMLVHQRFLSQEMARLLEKVEQSSSAWRALGFSALQQWQFWATAGGLLLLLVLCWCLWKRRLEPGNSSNHDSSQSLEEQEMVSEEEEYPLPLDGILKEHIVWPVPGSEGMRTMVEELVNELLGICRMLSSNSFMPQLQPAVGLCDFQEGHGEDRVYYLLVPLKPPSGHSFHLEQDTQGRNQVRNSYLCVELACMCSREQWLGDVLCFLHHPEEDPLITQDPSLLETLCNSSSCLDLQKTILWLHQTMVAACVVVPAAATCELRVLRSRRTCRLKVTNACNRSLFIELILGVDDGSSDTFVAME